MNPLNHGLKCPFFFSFFRDNIPWFLGDLSFNHMSCSLSGCHQSLRFFCEHDAVLTNMFCAGAKL